MTVTVYSELPGLQDTSTQFTSQYTTTRSLYREKHNSEKDCLCKQLQAGMKHRYPEGTV